MMQGVAARYHHKGKRREHLKATHQLKELQDNQGRNKHHLLHNQGKTTNNISKAKKRTNHHQASSQSTQGPQPSHQPAQPSQASRFEEASQFEQAS
ncbi:unnamed protein product [Prunus armeniaca]